MNTTPIPWPPRGVLLPLALGLALAACDAGSSASPDAAAASIDPVPVAEAVSAVEALDGDFTCAEPIRRADDFDWICEGSRAPMTATIHLFAGEVDGQIFGATLYTSAPSGDEDAAAEATASLALDLVAAVVPADWQQPVATWIDDRMPAGGRTLDVPDAGITAAVQPLAGLQWYVELYELDGLEG